MVDRQQTVGHGINVCLCVLRVSAVKLVVSRLIFLQMETADLLTGVFEKKWCAYRWVRRDFRYG